MRSSRWLIFAPVAILALFAQSAKADLLGDWTYSQSQDCGGSIEVIDNTITLHGPDNQGQGFALCGGQPHWVQISTTVPADVNTVDFDWSYQTNDGWVYDPPQYGINGVYTLITQVNISSGTLSVPVIEGDIFTFRQYSTDTCCQPGHLSISNLSLWQFTATTTTSIPVDTTIPTETTWDTTTTSTIQETSTSTIAPSTTVTVEEEPTTTIPQTTTTLPPDTTVPEETTTVPEPQTTEPIVTIPSETLPPDTTVPDTTVPDTTVPDTTVPDTTVPDVVDEIPEEVVQALLEAVDNGEELTEEQFDTVLEAFGELSEEQAIELIEQILDTAVTEEQATELASDPDVLAVITFEQAEEIFDTIDVTELDNTQLDALVEAVQDAPTQVREAFEDQINVFDDGLGDYVPLGSTGPVDTRRTLIAVAAGAATVAVGSRKIR